MTRRDHTQARVRIRAWVGVGLAAVAVMVAAGSASTAVVVSSNGLAGDPPEHEALPVQTDR